MPGGLRVAGATARSPRAAFSLPRQTHAISSHGSALCASGLFRYYVAESALHCPGHLHPLRSHRSGHAPSAADAPGSRPIGAALSRAVVLVLVIDVAQFAATGYGDPMGWGGGGLQRRVEIQQQLDQTPGKHLVIVNYEGAHSFHDEWVYNGADIDGSKVVWARDLGPEQNAKLMDYFKDRTIWMVKAGVETAPLARFPKIPQARPELGRFRCALYPIVLREDSCARTPPQTGDKKSPRLAIHDEFNYVLLGDSSAQGRLANASHPTWRSFEMLLIVVCLTP